MVIHKCYFSREHIALSYKKWCEHGIRKNKQIKSTAHDGKSYLKWTNYVFISSMIDMTANTEGTCQPFVLSYIVITFGWDTSNAARA